MAKLDNNPLAVDLCGIMLDNPIIPASGSFGYGEEFSKIYDINILGTFSFKGTTAQERFGNPTPRIAEAPAGMLNSVGLQNPGVDTVINKILPKMKGYFNKPVIANVCGFSANEYVEVASKLDKCEQIGWLEINVSCPNVHKGGTNFGSTPQGAADICKAVKQATTKPVIMKLSPNVSDIAQVAKACEKASADALSLINTLVGMRFDLNTGKPILANKTGGLSGPAILPIALNMVYQVANVVDIPIIGIGGISKAEDVIEMLHAGATAVEVGAANLADPLACKKIINKLPEIMDKYKIDHLSKLIGQ